MTGTSRRCTSIGILNVRGIRQREKRRDVIDFLRKCTFRKSFWVSTLRPYDTMYDCPSSIAKAIQRLVLIVKWYIYICKVRKEKPSYLNMLHLSKVLTEAEFMYIDDQSEEKVMDRNINMRLCCGQAG